MGQHREVTVPRVFFLEVTQDTLSSPSDKRWQCMQNANYLSWWETQSPGFLQSPSCLMPSKPQFPRRETIIQHKPHCSHETFRPSNSYLLGWWELSQNAGSQVLVKGPPYSQAFLRVSTLRLVLITLLYTIHHLGPVQSIFMAKFLSVGLPYSRVTPNCNFDFSFSLWGSWTKLLLTWMTWPVQGWGQRESHW